MRRGHPVSQLKTSVLSPAHLSGSRQRGKPQVQLRDNVCFCTTPETHTHTYTHTHIMQLLSTRKGKPQQREMLIPTLRAITLLVCVVHTYCNMLQTCCHLCWLQGVCVWVCVRVFQGWVFGPSGTETEISSHNLLQWASCASLRMPGALLMLFVCVCVDSVCVHVRY